MDEQQELSVNELMTLIAYMEDQIDKIERGEIECSNEKYGEILFLYEELNEKVEL